MARPNRNNKDIENIKVTATVPLPAYRTAIYARLSIEDNGCGSDSIENQIELLRKYVCNNEELTLVSTFYDNGMTGTNFDRPGFAAMLDEVKSGKINCIVVKDLSRFGRNYMEVGNYLEKIFPYLGVRFISVNDNYDSNSVTSNEALALSLKNVYHHLYAKDISRKICTTFDAKKKQGLFLGRFAPYGYKKSEHDRYRLEIDSETADIIRDIFRMRLGGMGVTAIARYLNDKGIPPYYKMLFEKGLVKGTNGEANALWSGGSVRGILENPVYCGHIVERKSDQAYYKGVKRQIPKSEWVYIENTHEPIIAQADFDEVQCLIEQSKQTVSKHLEQTSHRERTENILRGMLVCGYCKKKMARDGGYYDADGKLIRHRFSCTNKYRKGNHCRSASKVEAELLSSLFSIIQTQLQVLADTKALLDDYLKSAAYNKSKNGDLREMQNIAAQISQAKSKIQELYHDYKKGLVSENTYLFAQSEFEGEQRILEAKFNELQDREQAAKTVAEPALEWITEMLTFQKEPALSRKMCEALVDYVEVYDKQLAIHYTFEAEYEQIATFLSEYAKAGDTA